MKPMAEKKLHVKPTKEELKANALKAAEEFEKEQLPEPPKEEKVETSVETSKEEQVETSVEEEKKEEKVEEPKEEPKEEEKEEEPVVDYKKKYVDSTRGAQALREEKKNMDKAIDDASKIQQPTDEEMTAIYPDWDVMSDSEKRVATRTEMAERKFDLLHKASSASKSMTEWFDNVDKFIENPKTLINYPSLEGKQEEFKAYASKPTYKNADFFLIVKSFLFDMQKAKDNKPKHEGEMFPKGTSGPSVKDTVKNTISVDTLDRLQKTNYKLYREKQKLISLGKLQIEEIE